MCKEQRTKQTSNEQANKVVIHLKTIIARVYLCWAIESRTNWGAVESQFKIYRQNKKERQLSTKYRQRTSLTVH